MDAPKPPPGEHNSSTGGTPSTTLTVGRENKQFSALQPVVAEKKIASSMARLKPISDGVDSVFCIMYTVYYISYITF